MSRYVYAVGLGNGEPVEYDAIPKKDLMWELEENFRRYGHLPKEEFSAAWDAPATVNREWMGWPWALTVEHPLFGRIGCADEEDVGSVVALMRYVWDHSGDRAMLAPGTPWPEPWAVGEAATSIPLNQERA